jgi:DNA-binding NarL/FixJ family response regulator
MQQITVLLADDHTIVRQGFRLVLQAEPDIQIVGEAENGRQAVQLTKTLKPNVVVMDVAMPLLNGLGATRQILKAVPATRVLILSAYSEDEFVQELTEAGAAGYLLKQNAAADLLRGIREAYKGKAFFSPSIARRLLEQYKETLVKGVPMRRRSNQLTSRESEVLQLVAEGKANKQIAAELGLSIKTVEKHRQGVMKKLNLHDIASLTRYAISKGMIEAGPVGLAQAAEANSEEELLTTAEGGGTLATIQKARTYSKAAAS